MESCSICGKRILDSEEVFGLSKEMPDAPVCSSCVSTMRRIRQFSKSGDDRYKSTVDSFAAAFEQYEPDDDVLEYIHRFYAEQTGFMMRRIKEKEAAPTPPGPLGGNKRLFAVLGIVAALVLVIGIIIAVISNGTGGKWVCDDCGKEWRGEAYYGLQGNETMCSDCAEAYWAPLLYDNYVKERSKADATNVQGNAARNALRDETDGANIRDDILDEGVIKVYGDYEYCAYSNGVASITGYSGSGTDIVIPSILNGLRVVRIEHRAFQACDALTSVVVPDGVINIGYEAFEGCESLGRISIPNSVTGIDHYAFIDCISLASLTIPDSVTYIGDSAFANCTSLTSIKIPDSVTYIGNLAFFGCESLTKITLPNSTVAISAGAFYDTPWLNAQRVVDNWIMIGNGLQFAYVGNDRAITIPDKYRTFDFFSNTFVEQITIPHGTTDIASGAFMNCAALESVSIPDSVTNIGSYAFTGCDSLMSIAFPDNVTCIEECTFLGCTALTIVTVPDGITSIGDSAFWGCESLTSVSIPNSVNYIGGTVFSGCDALTILCNEGSYAWNYATKNGIPCKAL